MKKAIKWSLVAVGAVLAATVAYVAFNSSDCEPPDMSKFDNHFKVPSDEDNVYCGLVAVTNVISEKTGRPILMSLFCDENGRGPIPRFPKMTLTDADKDAILAESAKALSLYHEAVRRKTWWACDPAGKREPFPDIAAFWRLCVLVHLEAQRRLELGETGAAIDDVGDMLMLARKIENDAESDVRWRLAGLLTEKAADIALKVVKSGKSTDKDLTLLHAALLQYDIAARPKRAERALNNVVAVYFAWLCNPKHGINNNDKTDEGDTSRLLMRIPFLAPYTYHRNRTMAHCARCIEKIKQGVKSRYDEAKWDRTYHEIAESIGGECVFAPNFTGERLLWSELRAGVLIKSIHEGVKWYYAVESALVEAQRKSKAAQGR